MVFVDEKGRSSGQGIVDFTRKNNAQAAHKFCTEKCYFITSDLRPIVTEMGEMNEDDEGLLEGNLNKREYGKDRDLVYYKAREVLFCFITTNIFLFILHDENTELPFELYDTNSIWLLFALKLFNFIQHN